MTQLFILSGLIEPAVGLLFWTSLTFILLLILLRKFAWRPILNAIKQREQGITEALASAKNAQSEMQALKASNDKILKEAREERDKILKEAKDTSSNMIAEAKKKAEIEANNVLKAATEQIQNEKNKAIETLKLEVTNISISIAEKILQSELSSKDKQKELVNTYLKDIKLN